MNFKHAWSRVIIASVLIKTSNETYSHDGLRSQVIQTQECHKRDLRDSGASNAAGQ